MTNPSSYTPLPALLSTTFASIAQPAVPAETSRAR